MDELAYQVRRRAESRRLGIRVDALDRAVEAARQTAADLTPDDDAPPGIPAWRTQQAGARRQAPDQQGGEPRPAGCSLAAYAGAKRLPIEFLRERGLTEITYQGAPAIRIPYTSPDGGLVAVRFRIGLESGGDRFRWRQGSALALYGLDRLELARRAGYVVIVEGESDCHSLWCHEIPAVGLPGANGWREDRDAEHLAGIETIYVVIEPDRGGQTVMAWLRQSSIRDRVRLVTLGDWKDPSALHVADPDQFQERWQVAIDAAEPWPDVEATVLAEERQQAEADRLELWQQCRELAEAPAILPLVVSTLNRLLKKCPLAPGPTTRYHDVCPLDRVERQHAGRRRAAGRHVQL
ncbi:MAG: hypothetical protein FJZ01_24760, partial [Candidatus Sericytochromatia bacterium]|nr:hypothetical protein [Candidatus Tanganyikabacteria bacterium]